MMHITRKILVLFVTLISVSSHAQNKVVVIPMAGDSASCAWEYAFQGGTTGSVSCPANTFAVAGSCAAHGGNLVSSRPEGIAGVTTEAEEATGWICTTSGGGSMDVRALCCAK